nr:unnamed protein product [Digitaria exilis]
MAKDSSGVCRRIGLSLSSSSIIDGTSDDSGRPRFEHQSRHHHISRRHDSRSPQAGAYPDEVRRGAFPHGKTARRIATAHPRPSAPAVEHRSA